MNCICKIIHKLDTLCFNLFSTGTNFIGIVVNWLSLIFDKSPTGFRFSLTLNDVVVHFMKDKVVLVLIVLNSQSRKLCSNN